MSGWFRVEDEGWEEMVASLPPKPWRWPRALVLADLRYWENRAKMGGRFPSRAEFVERWGWTDRTTRDLLAGDQWHDPIDPVPAEELYKARAPRRSNVQATSKEGPSDVQDASQTTSASTESLETKGPSDVQATSKEGPSDVHARDPLLNQEPEPDQGPVARPPEDPPTRSPAQRVFAAWLEEFKARKASQGVRSNKSTWTDEEQDYIRSALKQASEAELVALVRWAFHGTDDYALGLQGRRSFGDGKTKEYLGIVTLFKDTGLANRIESGEAFASRPQAEPANTKPSPRRQLALEYARHVASMWERFSLTQSGASNVPEADQGPPPHGPAAYRAVLARLGPFQRPRGMLNAQLQAQRKAFEEAYADELEPHLTEEAA